MNNKTYFIEEINVVQQLCPPIEQKSQFGEVNTPFSVVHDMLDLLPAHLFRNPTLRWLDPGCGYGYFSIVLYNRLMRGLSRSIPDKSKRRRHILEHMITMVECCDTQCDEVRKLFAIDDVDDVTLQLHCRDFLSMEQIEFGGNSKGFDVVIGNPPYNAGGLKKVPTNQSLKKTNDGTTCWIDFVKHSMSHLKDDGMMSFIIPSIWLKPDKAKMYDYMMQYTIHKLRAFTNTETMKMFHNQAQTPTCYFSLQKREIKGDVQRIMLFDPMMEAYVPYVCHRGQSIPLTFASLVQTLRPFVEKYGSLERRVKKTNCIPKYVLTSREKTKQCSYKNVKTCLLDGLSPRLFIEYTSKPVQHHGVKKLIMAHKMYGFPCVDHSGEFGISTRDNYVLINESDEVLERYKAFLETTLVRCIFETTRYRMKYLEKYCFAFLPDIAAIDDFPSLITNESVFEYFGVSEEDIEFYRGVHKPYGAF